MDRWFVAQVWPNLVASMIWATPTFLASHLLLRRHVTRRTQTTSATPEETAP